MNFVQSIRAQKSRLATVSEHKQKVLPTVLSNSLDSAFQATNLAQLRAEQLETWSRARRRISHRRFALNIKRMLEDDACHKLTSLPKELLVKPAKEGKEQPSHLLKPKIRASIFASLNDGSWRPSQIWRKRRTSYSEAIPAWLFGSFDPEHSHLRMIMF